MGKVWNGDFFKNLESDILGSTQASPKVFISKYYHLDYAKYVNHPALPPCQHGRSKLHWGSKDGRC